METTHGGIGPRAVVLTGAQVMADELLDELALVGREADATRRTAPEHPHALLRMAVERDLAAGEEATRRDLADVVQRRRPTHGGTRHRLLHHRLGVLPDILVTAPALLREVERRVELGQDVLEHAGVA